MAADCSGVRGVRQKMADTESVLSSTPALSRSSSRGEAVLSPNRVKGLTLTCSLASSAVAPTASFFTQPSLLTTPETEFPVVRVIYDFTPTSPFELAVQG